MTTRDIEICNKNTAESLRELSKIPGFSAPDFTEPTIIDSLDSNELDSLAILEVSALSPAYKHLHKEVPQAMIDQLARKGIVVYRAD